jgi:UPF0755 protein
MTDHEEPGPRRPGSVRVSESSSSRLSRPRRRMRAIPGMLAVVVALAVVAGGFYFVVTRGVELLTQQFTGAEDYPGPGRGSVLVEVREGDSAAAIGRTLKGADVVASVDAFLRAAEDEPASRGIQVGFYELRRQMKATDALAVLIDAANLVTTSVTVPEGLRVVDVVALLADQTEFPAAAFERVLARPRQLGLPRYAGGEPEGYLFPATYAFGPNASPQSMLRTMVRRWEQAAEEVGLVERADDLGYTPHELMTIASLVEAEARGNDMPKVSRVIYNRLDTPGPPTFGKLEIDATVAYGLGEKLGVALTQEQLATDTPYNTRLRQGLPPGPIQNPGARAMQATVEPAEGDWLFYVTVDLATGETKFTDDYDEFLTYKAELEEYCETSEAC